jgi:hypothetical protein
MMKPSHPIFRDDWNIRPDEVERHGETNDDDYVNCAMHVRFCPTVLFAPTELSTIGWRD